MSLLEVKGTDQLIAAEDERPLTMGCHSGEGSCDTMAAALTGGGEGQGRWTGSQGCMPECVSVPGLVSRVEKEAAKPEG